MTAKLKETLMPAQKRIQVEQANIKTATVEIKALAINGKQMTLAVFRQIPEAELIDAETLQLRGIPWGQVNYFWGDINLKGAVHVLWQQDRELRRAIVRRAEVDWTMRSDRDEINKPDLLPYKTLYFEYQWIPGRWRKASFQEAAEHSQLRLHWEDAPGYDFNMKTELPPWPTLLAVPELPDSPYGIIAQTKREQLIAAYEQARRQREQVVTENEQRLKGYYTACLQRIRQRVEEHYNAHCDWEKRHNELVAQLEALDQIFIAV